MHFKMVKEITIQKKKDGKRNSNINQKKRNSKCRGTNEETKAILQAEMVQLLFFFTESNRVCCVFSFHGCKRVKGTMMICLMQITGRQLLGETVLLTLVKEVLTPRELRKNFFCNSSKLRQRQPLLNPTSPFDTKSNTT